MFFVNFWAVVLTFFLALITGEGKSGAAYCQENPAVISYIQMAAFASAIGQNFIFFTLSNFNSLTLASITTARKLMTFGVSVSLFSHNIVAVEWFGVALVFSALTLKLLGSTTKHSGGVFSSTGVEVL